MSDQFCEFDYMFWIIISLKEAILFHYLLSSKGQSLKKINKSLGFKTEKRLPLLLLYFDNVSRAFRRETGQKNHRPCI